MSTINIDNWKENYPNLREADLRFANFTHANLRNANLKFASLVGTNLSHADLSHANLCHANLRGADLRGADLRDADLSHADLTNANLCNADLSGAILPTQTELLERFFEFDDKGLIAYKVFNIWYSPPKSWEIKAGSIITETVNPDRGTTCGSGVNIGTISWIAQNKVAFNHTIWKVRVPFKHLADVVVPFTTNGKIRASYVELIEKVA